MSARHIRGWLAALLLAAAARPALPQAEVTALAHGLDPVDATTEVTCTRFASFEDEDQVAVGMALEPGDLLASSSDDVGLELTCAQGSVLRFSGSFRVLIDVPGEGADCAVNFLSGTLDVITDQPTEVAAGGVVLGSEGTQFAVVVERRDGQAHQRCSVYEGRVAWASPGSGRQWLAGGSRLDLTRERFETVKVDPTELGRVAERYARFDVAGSRAAGLRSADPEAAAREMASLHREVLEDPADSDRRAQLANALIDLRRVDQAGYHLERAGSQGSRELEKAQERFRAEVERQRRLEVETTKPAGQRRYR